MNASGQQLPMTGHLRRQSGTRAESHDKAATRQVHVPNPGQKRNKTQKGVSQFRAGAERRLSAASSRAASDSRNRDESWACRPGERQEDERQEGRDLGYGGGEHRMSSGEKKERKKQPTTCSVGSDASKSAIILSSMAKSLIPDHSRPRSENRCKVTLCKKKSGLSLSPFYLFVFFFF